MIRNGYKKIIIEEIALISVIYAYAISVFVGKQLNMCKTMPQITHTGANRQNQRLLHFFHERL